MLRRPSELHMESPRITADVLLMSLVSAGDGEDLLVEIGECLKQCKAEGLDRVETLFRLATSVDGVYVPQFYQSIEGACLA
jgi:hypothetical protein